MSFTKSGPKAQAALQNSLPKRLTKVSFTKSGPETQAALQNALLKLLAKTPYKSGPET